MKVEQGNLGMRGQKLASGRAGSEIGLHALFLRNRQSVAFSMLLPLRCFHWAQYEGTSASKLFPSSYKTRNHQRTMVDPYKMVDIRHNFRIIIIFTLHIVAILFYLNDIISGFLLGSNPSQFSSQVHISRDWF
jgi:hypothetical protein